MNRDLHQELEAIKRHLQAIEGAMAAGETADNPNLNALRERWETDAPAEGGQVAYLGVFATGGLQVSWQRDGVPTDNLLSLIESRMAHKVLACVGNSDRLNLLLALLRQPMTVAELVEKLGCNTTGQVYHHLKPLIAADLVIPARGEAKGTYTVQPHRVQGIIMLLAGIHDLVDIEHTRGTWEPSAQMHSGATMADERYMVTAAEIDKIIATYFESTDPYILTAFPPKQKKKLVILQVFAQQFQKGTKYAEKEVNDIIRPIFADFATIRRYLIEYGFMDRTPDGRAYWVVEK